MSEQWQGLHNPNQHKRYKDECRCVGCGDYEWCASEYPCRCCLAAEVKRLERAEAAIARVRELHHSKLDRHPQGDVQRCIACLDLWPCPTIRAIEGDAE